MCSVHLLYSGVANICLCGLPLTGGGGGGGDLAGLVQMACHVCWCCWLTLECVHLEWPDQEVLQLAKLFANFGLQFLGAQKYVCENKTDVCLQN